ncbi:hypothetical protein KBB49_00255 [Candidatus Saccharibacteria bacterium]|nr:hypothetical protein [Candidatus Saccharibacteria bacterium]
MSTEAGPSNESAMPPHHTIGEIAGFAGIGAMMLFGGVYAGANYVLHRGEQIVARAPGRLAERVRGLSALLERDGILEPVTPAFPKPRKVDILSAIGVEK